MVVLVPDDSPEPPGPVAEGLGLTLASLPAADPALAAAARGLAAAIDRSAAANPAAIAELRRIIGELRAEERRKAADRVPARRPPNRVAQLRAAHMATAAVRRRSGTL